MADSNVAAEVAKAVYEDAGHEIIQPTGKTLSLIPRESVRRYNHWKDGLWYKNIIWKC